MHWLERFLVIAIVIWHFNAISTQPEQIGQKAKETPTAMPKEDIWNVTIQSLEQYQRQYQDKQSELLKHHQEWQEPLSAQIDEETIDRYLVYWTAFAASKEYRKVLGWAEQDMVDLERVGAHNIILACGYTLEINSICAFDYNDSAGWRTMFQVRCDCSYERAWRGKCYHGIESTGYGTTYVVNPSNEIHEQIVDDLIHRRYRLSN